MGKAEHPGCIYGDADDDDAEHNFFYCQRWTEERALLITIVVELTPKNVIKIMITNKVNWSLVLRYVEKVLQTKKRDLDAINR